MWWLAKWNTTLCHYHTKCETQHNKSWSCDYAYIIQCIFIMWWLAKWNTRLCHYHMKWDTQHYKSWSCDYAYMIQYFNHDHVIGQKKHYDMTMTRTDKHNIMSHDHVTTHIWYNIFIMWLAKWNNNVIMIWSDKSNTMSHHVTTHISNNAVGLFGSCGWPKLKYHIIIDKHNVTKLYFEDMSLGGIY